MTRDEKLEAMAREWCKINGWQPDHRPIELEIERDADTNKMVGNYILDVGLGNAYSGADRPVKHDAFPDAEVRHG